MKPINIKKPLFFFFLIGCPTAIKPTLSIPFIGEVGAYVPLFAAGCTGTECTGGGVTGCW